MRGFQHIETTNEAIHINVAQMGKSRFTDKIEQTKPPHKLNVLYFTLLKGDGVLKRHLKHYHRAMIPARTTTP